MSSGKKSRLYRNTGSHAAPVLVNVPEARDISNPLAAESTDDSDRSSDFKKYCDGMIEVGITTTMSMRRGNANAQHMREAVLNGTVAEYFVLDGESTESGSEGLRFYGKVFTANGEHPLSDSRTLAIEIKPAHYEEGGVTINPSWYVTP